MLVQEIHVISATSYHVLLGSLDVFLSYEHARDRLVERQTEGWTDGQTLQSVMRPPGVRLQNILTTL